MIAAALSLLGFGKSALSAVWAFLSKLSPSQLGCIVLSIVAVVAVMRANHWKGVATERQATIVKMEADDAAAQAAVNKATATINALTADLRKATDEKNRADAADAAGLVQSGPGKARCPSVPKSPGGPVTPPADNGTAGPALPPDDSAAVPWNWLVTRAQEHDQLLNEDQAWRDWYAQVLKMWPTTGAAPK